MSSKSPGPKRKNCHVYKILMLDDQEVPFQIEVGFLGAFLDELDWWGLMCFVLMFLFHSQAKTTGSELINLVYQYLKLIESDYFGLEYVDIKGKKCWLDYDKPVSKQITSDSKLIFCVKFYTPDPGQLEEEYTRYVLGAAS